MRQPTRAQREKEAALRLGMGWVLGIGWHDGPVLLVTCADARKAEAVRKETARVEIMAGREGAGLVAACAFAGGSSAAVRRRVVDELGHLRVSGDLIAIPSTPFLMAVELAARAIGAVPMTERRRAEMIECDLIDIRV